MVMHELDLLMHPAHVLMMIWPKDNAGCVAKIVKCSREDSTEFYFAVF